MENKDNYVTPGELTIVLIIFLGMSLFFSWLFFSSSQPVKDLHLTDKQIQLCINTSFAQKHLTENFSIGFYSNGDIENTKDAAREIKALQSSLGQTNEEVNTLRNFLGCVYGN